jgi:hypothetical protein
MASDTTNGTLTPTIPTVAHFLLIYDRSAGQLLLKEEFATNAAALATRFAAEAEYGVQTNIEILAVSAASEADLKKSHGRYFLSSQELGERLVGAERLKA